MPNLLYDEMSGHDAQVENVVIDPVAETVTVSLLSYETAQSTDRIPISIEFKMVTSISTVMSFENLAMNRGAGNVSYWEIAKKAGTSFLHLTGGTLAITSRSAPMLVFGSG
jgi:hypothetical protein